MSWARIGIVLLLAAFIAAVFGAGRSLGVSSERAVWLGNKDKADQAARKDRERLLGVADAKVAQAQADAASARDFSTRLQQEITHVRVPLVSAVCRPRAVPGRAGIAVQPGSAVGPADGPAPQLAAADQPLPAALDGPAPAEPGGGAVLTLSAVRLWNSALAGEQLPAGACRADDPASEACAAESSVTFEDAWVNHADNAARCLVDRGNYQRLIEYLQSTQRPPGARNTEGITP